MPRAHIPNISTFIRFYELDPRTENQCIYVTQKGARCRWPSSNNDQAKELYLILLQYQGRDVDLSVLEKYIVSSCCRSGRAQHCDRIVDVGLLPSLAQRWQGEIMIKVQNRIRLDSATSERYRNVAQSPLSEFRPHVAQPTADDSVAYRIQIRLEDRDFESGSLYMFDRVSSPGHVKIGWTARSVQGRLDDWSRCGYIPNLLFSEHNIPFAQRAETLVHYELIYEWRRERMCKADWCRKSHREWFEVSVERAIKVMGSWSILFRSAPPYDAQGSLKPYWKDIVKAMIKNRETITGHTLLQRHMTPKPVKEIPIPRSAEWTTPIKSQFEELTQASAKNDNGRGEHGILAGPIPIKQQLPSGLLTPLSQSLPKQVSPLKTRLISALKRTKSASSIKAETISGHESWVDLGRLCGLGTGTSLAPTAVKKEFVIKAEDLDY